MANIAIYTGTSSFFPGDTPFGRYDYDHIFQSDIESTTKWCASRLGYPIVDIELQDSQFYSCFEEAVSEYSAQVNRFNIRENLLNLKGESTGSNFTHKNIIPNQGNMIKISKQYGTEAGSGGEIDWKQGYITTTTASVDTGNVPAGSWLQVYDLDIQTTFSQSTAGTDIEIKRVFHEGTPAMARRHDPRLGTNSALNTFGWAGSLTGTSYLALPLYDDLLRIQQIEFSDTIRKSMHSFELINNKLRLHPAPKSAYKIYFQYIETKDRSTGLLEDKVSDFSNVGYQDMEYKNINAPGKQWIRSYTLALVKVVLGAVRSKFASIPIPGSEVSLDGDTLRSEGAVEQEALISALREDLEQSSRRNQMERENEITTFQSEMLNKNPLNIFVG